MLRAIGENVSKIGFSWLKETEEQTAAVTFSLYILIGNTYIMKFLINLLSKFSVVLLHESILSRNADDLAANNAA